MKINEILTEQELQELNWKNALVTGALAATTAMGAISPNANAFDIGDRISPQQVQQLQNKNSLYKQWYDYLYARAESMGQIMDTRTINKIRTMATDKSAAGVDVPSSSSQPAQR